MAIMPSRFSAFAPGCAMTMISSLTGADLDDAGVVPERVHNLRVRGREPGSGNDDKAIAAAVARTARFEIDVAAVRIDATRALEADRTARTFGRLAANEN